MVGSGWPGLGKRNLIPGSAVDSGYGEYEA